jgi:hypothetical protein
VLNVDLYDKYALAIVSCATVLFGILVVEEIIL